MTMARCLQITLFIRAAQRPGQDVVDVGGRRREAEMPARGAERMLPQESLAHAPPLRAIATLRRRASLRVLFLLVLPPMVIAVPAIPHDPGTAGLGTWSARSKWHGISADISAHQERLRVDGVPAAAILRADLAQRQVQGG